jgi:hypothetical protein
MNTLVVKYDANTFKILGSAEELMEVVMLLSTSSYHVELGFELGLTILARRLGTNELVLDQIKNTLFGEIQDFVNKQASRDCAEFNQWSKSNFNANFDEVGIREWTDRLDRFSK